MSLTTLSRRNFIKGLSFAGASSILMGSASLSFLSGCSAPSSSKQSYMLEAIKPQYQSVIFSWTDIMLQAIRNQSITPPHATRIFAMAHTAGFLAVNGIVGGYNTHYGLERGPQGADPEVAFTVAFSMALSEAMQSSFIFDRNNFLGRYSDSEGKNQAIAYGRYAANAVIKNRVHDGAEPNKANFYLDRYARRGDVLQWAPTGPFYGAPHGPFLGNFKRGHLPGWGAQKTWVIQSANDYLAPEFADVQSLEFAEEYNRVKEIGATDSKTRTAEETEIAFFWEDGPRGVTPCGHWQLIAMRVTQDMNLPLIEQSRLLALLSLAQADAGIATWHSKYKHDIIRPETSIRQRADKFNNPGIRGTRDPNWRSLIFTPDFPSYASGHSAFSGASARMIANVIGRDDVKFSAKPPDMVNWPLQLAGVTRSWTSLWQAAEENGASRIYGGVHWDSDNIEGLRIGKEIADYVYNNAFSKAA